MRQIRLRPCFLTVVLLLFRSHVEICNGLSGEALNSMRSGELGAMAKGVCSGKVGECSPAEEMMDSDSNRRILLMQRRYISYATLLRDLVPCDRPGASYYNCKGPAVANSYNRGCEMITRCVRGY